MTAEPIHYDSWRWVAFGALVITIVFVWLVGSGLIWLPAVVMGVEPDWSIDVVRWPQDLDALLWFLAELRNVLFSLWTMFVLGGIAVLTRAFVKAQRRRQLTPTP